MKNIWIFYLKICQFLVVEFSIYLNRRVFVMWGETISLPCILPQQQKLSRKKTITWSKFCEWLPISNLTCILQWYILLQIFNRINASLQKLLSGNQYQHTNKAKSKKAHNSAKILQMISNIELDLHFTMIYLSANLESMHPCKSYWSETNINTPTKSRSKKGHISDKIWRMITNIDLDLYFTVL